MATWADVGRICATLPETGTGTAWGRPAYCVHDRWFVLDREARPDALTEDGEREEGLLVLYTPDHETKERLAADDSGYFRTSPHFARSRMILVRLTRIPADELREVIIESWLVRAPRRTAAAFLAEQGLPAQTDRPTDAP